MACDVVVHLSFCCFVVLLLRWSIEVTCNVFFTVEIIMRFLAEKSVRKYLEQPLNTVDVVRHSHAVWMLYV